MNRKNFIKKLAKGSLSTVIGASTMNATAKDKAEDKKTSVEQIGFNHLPNKEIKTMKTVLHTSDSRGHANHGWLNSHHTFSFANYYNPERIHFGMLRVLNDDTVSAGRGFGTHPHDNMEIISIPLEGDLEHKDSMGNTAVIKQGDVQVMSAGTGVYHSEYNKNEDSEVKFLQIWVFPNKKNVTPRYDQISTADIEKKNTFYQVVSPNQHDEGVWMHQDAWFHIGQFDEAKEETYKIRKPGNGVYAFVLEGNAEVEGQSLNKRDGFGVWDTEEITISAQPGSKILLMEVPMA
jgi:redox-sensitive bicupin YhaK (pirin superfamily)